MRPLLMLLIVVGLAPVEWAGAEDQPLVPQAGSSFRVAAGLVVEPVAMSPLVEYPIVADFDRRGRLYVAESAGPIGDLAKQQAAPPHRVVRLEDGDGDGVFDKRVVFAEGLMLPEGVLCLDDNTVLVSAVPQIWKLQDTDDDGRADRREVWFDGGTLTGCGNDLHGPYRGPDGWIYWCKGAFAEQSPERLDGSRRTSRAAHIYRRHPSGGPVDIVMTGGMDNPIEVAFNAVGDRFFTTTFVLHPGGGKRDGIVHAIYGAVYGKDHDVVNDHVRTGPLFGPMTHLGPAAPSGLATLQSDLLIPDGRGLLACTQFNLQKVSLHELQPMGATYRTIDRDLLISDAIDFHPTDVLEDVDGSLLVIDTGGWYDLCCPTSGLDQAKAYGGIYRIRRAGDAVADPRGKELAWDRLSLEQQVGLLSDPRPFVRRQAAEALQSHGPAVVPLLEALAQNPGALSDRCDAVWLLDRSGSSEARQSLSRLAQHADDPVAQAALRALSLRPTDADALVAEAALADCEAPHRQRAGAELLSRLPGQRSAPAILAALGDLPLSAADGLPDRTTFHALTYALIRQGSAVEDDPLLRQALEDGPPAARAAVLLCIDQHDARGQLMPPSATQPIVDAWLAGSPIERGTAHWILGHRPEAAAAIADRWEDVLQRVADEIETPPADGLRSLEVLADQLAEPALVERTAAWLRDVDADHPAALAILEQGLARNHSERLPRGWVMAIVERLPQAESPLRDGLFNVLRGQKVDDDLRAVVCERLDDVAARADLPLETRLAALAARPAAGPALPPAALAAMQDGLSAESGSSLRRMALEGLQRVPVSTELHGLLVELAQSANPVELPPLLATIQRDGSADLARQIIAAMIDNPAAWRLPPQSLDGFSSVSDPAVQAALQTLQQRTAHAMAEQRDQLARLLGELDEGDAVAGYQVFRSSKAACSACHEIGYVGGQVGPDLSKIGSIRRRAELLEAIVMPSNSIVQSYDPVSIVTLDGRVFNGLVKETRPDGLLLVTGVDQQVRLQHDEIDTMQSSDVSIMPAGLEQVLTRRELADLLAFLESAR